MSKEEKVCAACDSTKDVQVDELGAYCKRCRRDAAWQSGTGRYQDFALSRGQQP